MTDSQTHELIGRKREEYRQTKKQRAAELAKLGEMAKYAETIQRGLKFPERIIWWTGTPNIGQRPDHIVFTSAMFDELTEDKVKQHCADLKRLEAVVASLRTELTNLEGEDPEKG